jgi:hypothetical protein
VRELGFECGGTYVDVHFGCDGIVRVVVMLPQTSDVMVCCFDVHESFAKTVL